MGCGKSKHDVATGNTIALKKSNAGGQTSKDLAIIQEASNKGNSFEKNEISGVADHDNVKDIVENKEEKTGRLISKDSPHKFFSSRKDDDVEGEGRSDKSEAFYSPRVESGKETLFNVENGKMNDDKLVQETGEKDETAIVEEKKTGSSVDKPDVTSPALEKKQTAEETVAVSVTQDEKAI